MILRNEIYGTVLGCLCLYVVNAISKTGNMIGRVKFTGLKSYQFAHPLDLQIRDQLSRLPLLEVLTRSVTAYAEQAVNVDNLARGVLVGPRQMATLNDLLVESCDILDIKDIPDLYIRQNPVPNAYTMAINGRKPFIVMHSSTLDLLSPTELQTVLAHELGHLKCEHGLWITAANIMTLGVGQLGVVGQLLAPILESLLLRWQRSAEYTCDRAALLVAGDWRTVAITFLKLSGGSNSYGSSLDLDAFMEQSKRFDEAIKTAVGSAVSRGLEEGSTHPLPIIRVRELKKWSEGPQYRGLNQRGASLTT